MTAPLGKKHMLRSALIGMAGELATSSSFAHVTLENEQAAVGATYKAVLQVTHGCSGSPTSAIRVRIPEGIVSVKPMPKAGWKLDVVTGKYAKPYSLGEAKISEGVTEVAWSGGSLGNAFYEEFVFLAAVANELKAGQTVYFPVVQQCERGIHRWIEIPTGTEAHGGGHDDGGQPAPGLKLLPKR